MIIPAAAALQRHSAAIPLGVFLWVYPFGRFPSGISHLGVSLWVSSFGNSLSGTAFWGYPLAVPAVTAVPAIAAVVPAVQAVVISAHVQPTQ